MAFDNIHFVTGRLAEPALRHLLPELSKKVGFDYSIQVMPITVAALMTPSWIATRLEIPEQATKIIVPRPLPRRHVAIQRKDRPTN